MQPQSTCKAILIANAKSGKSRRLFRLMSGLDRHGIELLSTHFDLRPDAVRSALERAERDGVGTVLVSGGDGTVGCVLTHLVGRPFTLGVIPSGTSNDFARSLLIPTSIEGAVQVVAGGMRARVDLGEVNGAVFGHAAVLGLNTDFARRADRLRKVLGRLSYPLAAVQVYRKRRCVTVEVTIDGDTRRYSVFELAFVNAPVYGGALELEVAGAELTDHHLRVLVIEDLRLGTVLRALPRVLQRKRLSLPGFESFTMREARVETSQSESITVDGELRASTPATVRVLPGALTVFAPEQFLVSERAPTP